MKRDNGDNDTYQKINQLCIRYRETADYDKKHEILGQVFVLAMPLLRVGPATREIPESYRASGI